MTRNKILYETSKFYFDKKKSVHISLESNTWLNGTISEVKEDRLILIDEKFGEMIVLFDRIKDDGIEPREEKR